MSNKRYRANLTTIAQIINNSNIASQLLLNASTFMLCFFNKLNLLFTILNFKR